MHLENKNLSYFNIVIDHCIFAHVFNAQRVPRVESLEQLYAPACDGLLGAWHDTTHSSLRA